jgi:BNR/Asp-box repeat protein
MSRRCFQMSLVIGPLLVIASILAPIRGDDKAAPRPRIVRVTPPEAERAVEVSVAINPTNPDHLIAVSIARLPKHPGISDFAFVSTDAGKTWNAIPRENPHQTQQGDDAITFTPDGTAIHAFISFVGIRQPRPRRAHNGIVTSTSKDGIEWSKQAPVIEAFNSVEPYEDKPWIKADMAKTSPHYGNLYVAWTKFDVYGSDKPEHKTHIYFSRSTDRGKSFAVPFRISDTPGDARDKSDTVMGAYPACGPNGEVFVVWAGPKHLFFAKSKNGGTSFEKSSEIVDCAGWDFAIKGLGRASSLPSMGVDITSGPNSGTIYVNWGDTRNGDPDVFLMSSRDGGATWSEPLRVNNDELKNGKEQWFPAMSVDPIDGSINIAYYDRGIQNDTNTDVTMARSVDGGKTFVYTKLNDEAYDLNRIGFFGDYLGIDAYGGRVTVLWMHPLEKTKKLGISSAVLDFEPGMQTGRKQ